MPGLRLACGVIGYPRPVSRLAVAATPGRAQPGPAPRRPPGRPASPWPSTVLACSAVKTGPSGSMRFSGSGPRSLATGRTLMRTGAALRGAALRGAGGNWPARPGREARLPQDAGNAAFVGHRHHVHPGDAGNLPELADYFCAQALALLGEPVLAAAAQPVGDGLGDMHARHFVLQMAECPQGQDRSDAGQDVTPLVQPEVAQPGHPGCEGGHVEDELGLHELRARGYLGSQPGNADLGRAARILDGADQPAGRGVEGAPRDST